MAATTMTRKTFYVHFADVGELLVALVRPLRTALDEQLARWSVVDEKSPKQPPVDLDVAAAEAAFTAAQEHYQRHSALLRTIWRLADSVDGAREARTEILEPFRASATAFLLRHNPSLSVNQASEIAHVLASMNATELIELSTISESERTGRLGAIREIWARVAGIDR